MQVKSVAECSEKHSAILLTFTKLPFVIKIFVLSFLSGRLQQVLLYMHKAKKMIVCSGFSVLTHPGNVKRSDSFGGALYWGEKNIWKVWS